MQAYAASLQADVLRKYNPLIKSQRLYSCLPRRLDRPCGYLGSPEATYCCRNISCRWRTVRSKREASRSVGRLPSTRTSGWCQLVAQQTEVHMIVAYCILKSSDITNQILWSHET